MTDGSTDERAGRTALAGIVLAGLVACTGPGDGTARSDTAGAAVVGPFTALPPERRAIVPPFELDQLGGGRLRLADYGGRIVLLNFWASWCGPCRVELPALSALAEELTGPDFVFLTVSDDTDTARAAAFAAELGLAYPVGLGLGRMRGRHYGFGLPFTVLVDAAGRGMYRWYGYGGDTQLVAIRAMVTAERERRGHPSPDDRAAPALEILDR
jgi:thiol-disulfide isomerase/thioredoxin